MDIRISKKPVNAAGFIRSPISFPNARTAFEAFLLAIGFSNGDKILLPSYIGWSPNEGSGVFDPVRAVGVGCDFYRINRDLTIDVEDFEKKIISGQFRLVVIIHFFGYVDPNSARIIEMARNNGIYVLEDEAHAMYTDLVGGITGRLGDAAIFSLHKMLPFSSGGMLVLNRDDNDLRHKLLNSPLQKPLEQNPFDYDLTKIALIRRENAEKLIRLLESLAGQVDLLYQLIPDGVIPQTLPVIIAGDLRDQFYFKLNENGFGVVSLYHTLIQSISKTEFPDSHWLARHILNLPVHQDVASEDLNALVLQIKKLMC